MDDKKLQLRVGLLILLALVILGGFIFVLGDFSMAKGFELNVTFSQSGDLATGAAVRIAGIKVGKVQKLTFKPEAAQDEKTGKRPVIHLTLKIDETARALVRSDSVFYITARGVLGEKYVGVTSGSPAQAEAKDGQLFLGQDPPQTDLVVAKLMDFVDDMATMLKKDGHLIRRILLKGGDVLETADTMLKENRGEVKNIFTKTSGVVDKVTAMIDEARPVVGDVRSLIAKVKHELGEEGRVQAILRDVKDITGTARRETPLIIAKVKHIADKGSKLADKLGGLADKAVSLADDGKGLIGDGKLLVGDVRAIIAKEKGKISKVVDKLVAMGTEAKQTISHVHAMVARIARGEGSIGALLKDDELYDNIREIMRDLKQHPWKVLWKD